MQPLLSRGGSSLPLKPLASSAVKATPAASARLHDDPPSLDPHGRLSLAEAASAAVRHDIQTRMPPGCRIRLLKKARRIRAQLRGDEDGELAEIISSVPDLEAIFLQGEEHPFLEGGRHGKAPHIAAELASSYGAINGPPHQRNGKTESSNSASASHLPEVDRRSSLSAGASPSATTKARLAVDPNAVREEDDYQTDHRNELFEELTNPVGKYRRVWLLVMFTFTLYNAVMVPFLLAFQSTWHQFHVIVTALVILYLGDLFFCLDVVLYFFTPYTRDGMYERNLKDIRSHYLQTWFIPDLLASVPFDLLLLPLGLEAVLICRFTRFLRFKKYDTYFEVRHGTQCTGEQGRANARRVDCRC